MTFSVNNISAAVNMKKGLLRPSNFEVIMPTGHVPGSRMQMQELRLFADKAIIPGLNLQTSEITHGGYGMIEKRPYLAATQDIQIEFMVDGNSDITDFFDRWMRLISNFDGYASNKSNRDQFEYPDNYSVDFMIRQYTNDGVMSKEHKIIRAYPLMIVPTSLDWATQNTITKLLVDFSYLTWTTNFLE